MNMLYECQLMGRLGKDAILEQHNGSQVVKFSVCHVKKFKNSAGVIGDTVTWFECSYWRGPKDDASVYELLKKGDMVLLKGTVGAEPVVRDGKPAMFLTFRIDQIFLLPNRR